MSKKNILIYAALCGILGATGWRIYSGSSDLASLSRMEERHSSAFYDGEKRIAQALTTAKRDGKLVLVQSSAQGCTWCHVLHDLLTTNQEIAAKIQKDFIYVLVDTTNDQNRDFYKKHARNTEHTLVLIVMDGNGRQLAIRIGGL
jgi:thioredoxin-related protein